MVVIGRKPGECIIINKNITVKLVKNKNGSLRLAIDAPNSMVIERGEARESSV